nr:hypothetical protein [Wolbachia endosymbiont (group A) of Sphecodes ephippius]
MRDLYSKTNAPYLIAGAVATLVLLASGTLAVAPYVAFLSPIAAFNVALPVALSLSILSILVLALSCKIISNNVELEAKVKGQLEHKEEILSFEHQELRDENTRLNERVDSLIEELCQCKLESEKNKLCLKSEYEDELRLRLEYEDELNLELEHKSREASSLRTQLTMLRKKVEVEEVKQLKTLESEEQHESSESDIEELEKKLCQSEKEKKELEGKVSDERQKRTDLESKVDKLCTKEKEYLSKIKELEKESLSLQKEEKESDNTLTTVNDDRDNKVKELNSSLLKQSSQIEQLQKALLEKKKEEVLFLQRMIEYVTDEVEKLVRENEVIRDDDKKVILQVIQATKSVLVEEAAQYLPGETSVPSFVEDPGYTSGCSTPTNSCHTF